MTPKPSATSSWAPLLWACYCLAISPVGARAELSQADITAAINAAIIVPKVNNNGQIFQTALYRGSSSIASLQYQTNLELGRFKQAVLQALADLTNTPASAGASAWTTNDVAALLAQIADKDGYLADIAYNVGQLYDASEKHIRRLSFESDPGGDLLRTWDPNTLAISDTLDEDVVPVMRSIQQNLAAALKTISDNTATIVQQGDTPDPNLDKIADDVDAIRTSSYSTAHSVGEASDRSEYMGDPQAPGHDKEGIAGPAVSVDSSALDEDITIDVGGDARLYLWRGMSFDGRKLPDGVIDFSTGQIGNACYYMRRICSTLWWLVYYAALAVLLRREYVYYSSLGHTEGAA